MGHGCTKLKHNYSSVKKEVGLVAVPEVTKVPCKVSEDFNMIVSALNSHFIFTSLSEEDKEVIAESMDLYSFKPNSLIMVQNETSDTYFVLRTGYLEVVIDGKKVNRVLPGEGFGELSLLHQKNNNASVVAFDFCTLWGIHRENFRKVVEEVNIKSFEENREFLEKVSLLSSLSSEQKDILAANLVTLKYQAGQKIVTEGETGQYLFIIKEGTVSIQKENLEVARCAPGSYFGEQALLYNSLRTATCVALEGTVKCVCLARETLQRVLGNNLQDIIQTNAIFEAISKSETLSCLNKHQKRQIKEGLSIKHYKGGDVVIHTNTLCKSKLYFVLEGNLKYARSGLVFADKGNSVGAEYVTQTSPLEDVYWDDVIAGNEKNTSVGELTKYQFEVCIGGKFSEVVKENAATNILMKVNLFRHIDNKNFKYLFNMIRVEKYKHGEVVCGSNSRNNCIFIVKRGRVEVSQRNRVLRVATKHDYFGERALLFGTSEVKCVAQGSVTLWTVQNSDFTSMINDKVRKDLLHRVELEDEEVSLYELQVVKLLGNGTTKVYKVTNCEKDCVYALKVYPKDSLTQCFFYEKEALQMLDHPFIYKLVKTFEDQKRFFLMLEYIKGFTLDFGLEQSGTFSVAEAQFYAASIILSIQYLHERKIVHRNICPDNLMVDDQGTLKLTGLTNAKVLKNRTFTLVGTPYYTAPEVIAGLGYTKYVDYWSLGVCLYEFLFGSVPFGSGLEDPYEIYSEILEMKIVIEAEDSTKAFLEQLLSKFPEARLGSSHESIKKHEWFAGFDWEALLQQSLTPPFKPKYSPEDVQNSFEPNWDELVN